MFRLYKQSGVQENADVIYNMHMEMFNTEI